MCVHLKKEDSQKTMTTTDKIRETTKTKDLQYMKTNALASTTLTRCPIVSGYFTHLLDFALYFVSLNQLLSMFPHILFSHVCEFLVTVHTAKTGLLRCCIYTLRQLQQTDVSCKRSNCNKNLESRHV